MRISRLVCSDRSSLAVLVGANPAIAQNHFLRPAVAKEAGQQVS
jgi:hypothetical protein